MVETEVTKRPPRKMMVVSIRSPLDPLADFANAISINYYRLGPMHIYARDVHIVLPLIATEGRANRK